MKWFILVAVVAVLALGCGPATKIGTGLDCWPESCAEKERQERAEEERDAG